MKFRFLATFLLFSALCHLYLGWRVVGPLPGSLGLRLLVSSPFIGLFVLGFLATRYLGDGGRTGWRRRVVSVFYFWLVVVLLGCMLFAVRDTIWLICGGVGSIFDVELLPADADRSEWLHHNNLILLAVLLLVAAWGNYSARRVPRIRKITIEFPELPSDLDGFRIAHLSDLHLGPYVRPNTFSKVIDLVNSSKPDIVAITGDLVDGPVGVWGEIARPLGTLCSSHGTFVVFGNHEYYSGGKEWNDLLSELGIEVLANRNVSVKVRSQRIRVAGITDPAATQILPEETPDLEAAMADVAQEDFTVLLAHRPDVANDAAQAGVDLQLSGHTHGGQVFPFGLLARSHQSGFLAGIYGVKGTRLYVSRGVGFWGPAMRLLAPSEIAVITLRSELQ